MAARHWVGGSADWDSTAGSKWSLTNGGAGGQAVPTAADDVYFDSGSLGVVYIVGSRPCLSLNFTGFTGTITSGVGGFFLVTGAVTLAAGMTIGANVSWFVGTGTFTTAGKTLDVVGITSGVTVTMADALTCTTLLIGGPASVLYLKSGVTSTIGSLVDLTDTTGTFTLGATLASPATLSCASGTVSIRYCAISYSTAIGGAVFTAGPGATDSGNNTGWTFLTQGTPLFDLGAF